MSVIMYLDQRCTDASIGIYIRIGTNIIVVSVRINILVRTSNRHAPIMLSSNAPNFSLLCPNYAPMVPVMLYTV